MSNKRNWQMLGDELPRIISKLLRTGTRADERDRSPDSREILVEQSKRSLACSVSNRLEVTGATKT